MTDQAPNAAYIAWVKAIPAVHCVQPAVTPWTHVNGTTKFAVSPTDNFAESVIDINPAKLTTVASRSSAYWYAAGQVNAAHAAVLHAGSEAEEWTFTAVISGAGKPPRDIVTLAEAPRTNGNVGLGSSRSAVERVFGHAHATTTCGYDVVRYEPRTPAASEAEMWFIYRHGSVVAFAHYEAV